MQENSRIVVWFSHGATSAVAAKLTVQRYGHDNVHVVLCDTRSEHPSNAKFLTDVENWIRHPIEILASKEYKDIWDVFTRTGWLVGPKGARCTAELKKALRFAYQRPDDIQVFGYDADERLRAETFRQQNPDVLLETPLIAKGLTKTACLSILTQEGIELPFMYQPQKSGAPYNHNNCIGCVKGQMGYWNKVRIDFPDVFERMAKLERELNVAICKKEGPNRKRIPVFLDELPPDAGRFEDEPPMACDLLCGAALAEVREHNSSSPWFHLIK